MRKGLLSSPLLWCSLVGVAVFSWALRPIWDMDLWWHIALGNWILNHGFPVTDPLAIGRGDTPWATFQGGYEVVVAVVERWGGLLGVRILHAGAIGVGFGVLARGLFRLNTNGLLAACAIGLTIFLYEDRIRVRPHVFHFLFLSLFLAAQCHTYRMWHRRDAFWILPILFVWSTFHGPGSLWGLLAIGATTVAYPRNRAGWEVLGAAIAVVLLSPGVFDGLVSAFSVHTRPGIQARFVPEHGNLFHYASMGTRGLLVVGSVLLSSVLAGIGIVRHGKTLFQSHRGLLLFAVPLALFSVLFARFSWYAIGPLLIVGATLPLTRSIGGPILVGIAGLLVWDASSYVMPRYANMETHRWATDIQRGHPHHFPIGATHFLKRAGIRGQVYNDVGWGGWILYELPEGTRTLYDSRIAFTEDATDLLLEDEHVMTQRRMGLRSPEASVRRAAEIQFGREREALAERAAALGADILLRKGPVFGTAGIGATPKNWELVYRDPGAEVWLRKNDRLSSRLERIQQTWSTSRGDAETDGLR